MSSANIPEAPSRQPLSPPAGCGRLPARKNVSRKVRLIETYTAECAVVLWAITNVAKRYSDQAPQQHVLRGRESAVEEASLGMSYGKSCI